MTRMHLIAKLALTVLGLFFLIEFLNVLAISSSFLLTGLRLGWLQGVFWAVVWLLLLGSAYWLLFRYDNLPVRMVGFECSDGPPVDALWVAGGFRVVFVLCGLLVLAGRIETLVRAVVFVAIGPKVIIDMIVRGYVDEVFRMPVSSWAKWIVDICKAALGIYLVLGAPQFVHWQVSKFYARTSAEAKVQEQ